MLRTVEPGLLAYRSDITHPVGSHRVVSALISCLRHGNRVKPCFCFAAGSETACGENTYRENTYRENAYRENAYRENTYRENPYRENTYCEDVYNGPPYNETAYGILAALRV